MTETEGVIFERSKKISHHKVTKCPWKIDYKDLSEWTFIFCERVAKYINPMLNLERPKAMCAGDSYCEYIFTLEE